MNYAVIKLSQSGKSYPTFSRNTKGWISYDSDNLLPQRIIALNNESAINKAVIDNKVTYICGTGVKDDEYYGQPNPNDDWDQLIEKIAKDYVTFGGYCMQVIFNENGKTVSLYHTDFSKIRIGETNEFGAYLSFYLSNDWRKTYGKHAPVQIKAYGSEEMQKGVPYLFYYRDYEPSLDYYPVPQYYSALNYIEADGLLGKFYRNSINNGFVPSTIITMPSNPADEQKEQFQRDIENSYAGTNGANSIVVLWGESQEVKPVVTSYAASGNADLYNNVDEIIFQKIISAHRLTSPTLAGLSGSGNLSGNANEITNSYVLYNRTVIHQLRRKILDTLSIFTVNNGYKKLVIDDLDIVKDLAADGKASL
ncbi:phage portal protein [Dysgonomonas sp. Marseille-P4677]|nr:phage portal protein [Dysgonomonas sp. Marseille-P4677]